MSQLTFAQIPGFFDITSSVLASGQPLTDDTIQKISDNAKFGAVRPEYLYMGFFHHGDTVGVPTSPVDGYNYSRGEVKYDWRRTSSRLPAGGFTPGQQTNPGQANSNSGAGSVFWWQDDVDDATGTVTMKTSYWDGSHELITNDGYMKVYAVCTRLSVNESN